MPFTRSSWRIAAMSWSTAASLCPALVANCWRGRRSDRPIWKGGGCEPRHDPKLSFRRALHRRLRAGHADPWRRRRLADRARDRADMAALVANDRLYAPARAHRAVHSFRAVPGHFPLALLLSDRHGILLRLRLAWLYRDARQPNGHAISLAAAPHRAVFLVAPLADGRQTGEGFQQPLADFRDPASKKGDAGEDEQATHRFLHLGEMCAKPGEKSGKGLDGQGSQEKGDAESERIDRQQSGAFRDRRFRGGD